MLFDVAAASAGTLVNWREIVSALSSARLVKVTMPFAAVCVVVPCRGPEPLLSDGGDLGRVVAGLKVAELVFDVDDRLGRERSAGCRRGGRLRHEHQLGRRRRADDDVVRCRGGQDGNAGELERDRLGLVVGQVGECGDAAGDRHRGGALQRATTQAQRRRHLGCVVAGLDVAVLVFDVDDRLGAEGDACRRCRARAVC